MAGVWTFLVIGVMLVGLLAPESSGFLLLCNAASSKSTERQDERKRIMRSLETRRISSDASK
jgi:hypothetical protein